MKMGNAKDSADFDVGNADLDEVGSDEMAAAGPCSAGRVHKPENFLVFDSCCRCHCWVES